MDEYLIAALVVLLPVLSGALPRLMKRRSERTIDEAARAAIERSSPQLAIFGVLQIGYARGRRRRTPYRRITLSSADGGELSFYLHGNDAAEIEQEILNGGFAFQVTMTAKRSHGAQARWGRGPVPSSRAWWRVLGVSLGAGEGEIRAAWRERARAAHPDAGGSDAEMSEINVARDAGLTYLRTRERSTRPAATN